jgi:hypothetical protein
MNARPYQTVFPARGAAWAVFMAPLQGGFWNDWGQPMNDRRWLQGRFLYWERSRERSAEERPVIPWREDHEKALGNEADGHTSGHPTSDDPIRTARTVSYGPRRCGRARTRRAAIPPSRRLPFGNSTCRWNRMFYRHWPCGGTSSWRRCGRPKWDTLSRARVNVGNAQRTPRGRSLFVIWPTVHLTSRHCFAFACQKS